MNPKYVKAYTLLLTASLIWGIASLVIKFTLNGIDPLPFLLYRFLISAVLGLFFLSKAKQIRFKSWKELVLFIAYVLLSAPFALGFLFLGLDSTTVLNLSLITLSGPLLVEAAGVIFLKEHLTKREKIGTAIAFLGTLLTIVKPILDNTEGIGSLSGNLLITLYLVGDIAAIVLLKKLMRRSFSPEVLTHTSFIVGFIVLLPLAFVGSNFTDMVAQIRHLELPYHAGVWYMAVLSGTLAYTIRARGQKTIEIGRAALFGYLTPVFSTILAPFLLGEHITPLFIIGAAIIALGVLVAETKGRKKKNVL